MPTDVVMHELIANIPSQRESREYNVQLTLTLIISYNDKVT